MGLARVSWFAVLLLANGAAGCTKKSHTGMDAERSTPPTTTPAQPENTAPAGTDGETCGDKLCPAGQVCCNASCGICAAPGDLCTQEFCEPAAPDPGAAGDKPGAGACKTNADCHAASDYCTGCDCRALGPGQTLPACAGPGVRCLVDPCDRKIAVCQDGACVIRPAA